MVKCPIKYAKALASKPHFYGANMQLLQNGATALSSTTFNKTTLSITIKHATLSPWHSVKQHPA
jgi:hypothetical protein